MVPEVFRSKDIVYHYTSMETAMDYILKEGRLRLSPRYKSSDPVESSKPSFHHPLFAGSEEEIDLIENGVRESIPYIEKFILKHLRNNKQLCFCMNDQLEQFENVSYQNSLLDSYGFMKPRMWDQYGSKYQGVCLAFSLETILKNSSFLHKKMDYLDFKSISNLFPVDQNSLFDKGKEQYMKYYEKLLHDYVFKKHKDYRDENEYRVCSFSENEFDYVDIKDSIRGIIFYKNNVDQKYEENIDRIADRLNIDIIKIDYKYNMTVSSRNEMIRFKTIMDDIDF